MNDKQIANLFASQGVDFVSKIYEAGVDLTDATADMKIRTRPDPNATLLWEGTDTDGIMLGGADQTLQFTIPAAVTETINSGEYFFSLLIVLDSVTYLFLNGTIQMEGSTV